MKKFILTLSILSSCFIANKSFAIDLNNIENSDCKRLYDRCMNLQCYNDGFGRCGCSSMAEQNIPEDKRADIKPIGYSVYVKQKQECASLLNQCPTLKRKIVSEYKMAMDNDCAQLALGNIKTNLQKAAEDSYFGRYEKFKSCMKPLCSEGKDPDLQFTKCFTADAINKVGNHCSAHADSPGQLMELKEEFLSDMGNVKRVYCDRIDSGQIVNAANNAGECKVEIAFGYYKPNNARQRDAQDVAQTQETGMKIFATRMFGIGDIIDCTEAGFNTVAKVKDNTAKLQKALIQSEKIRVVGSYISITGAVANTVGGIVSAAEASKAANKVAEAAAETGKKVTDTATGFQKGMRTVNMVSSGLSSSLFAVSGIMNAMVRTEQLNEQSKKIIDTSKNNLFCFMDQRPIIQEGAKFKLNWIE
ncbi:MAG: hypothetical protein N4A44_02925 [Alphaproteobacteria bacterium]|jgi:hypothetical protein|nr:hypothetical protein [Alphaproteobacteria bacterium]